ncbi:MAG: peptide chain release factor N(5)-glutamine methyltransferase [Bacilli bacterium]|nr:peptide chain release factor N(5)-glutamine methyltransferase [Bacilli bacterium]
MTDKEYLEKYLEKSKLEKGLQKLKQGIPVQYIVGNTNFYGNIIKVNQNVLIPRFETELLVEKTYNYIKKYFSKKVTILDIGTGSGCIAITLKKMLNSKVTAVDISKKALEIAKENATQNNVNVDFILSNLFSNIKGKFDVIISNPPYIAYDEKIDEKVKNNEPHLALYANNKGLEFYEKILKEAKKYLNEKAIIAFEIGENQGEDISEIAKKYFKEAYITVEKDLPGKDRFIFIFKNLR